MTNIPIDRSAWVEFFNDVSRNMQHHPVDVEVAGVDYGDQMEEQWALLDGLSFDEVEDVIFIHTETLDHAITSPLQVNVMSQGAVIECVSVRDKDGSVHLVHFHQNTLLPSSVKN